MIATRTRDALARAKARGVKLGGPKLAQARRAAVEAIGASADRHAANVLPIIREIRCGDPPSVYASAMARSDVAPARCTGRHRQSITPLRAPETALVLSQFCVASKEPTRSSSFFARSACSLVSYARRCLPARRFPPSAVSRKLLLTRGVSPRREGSRHRPCRWVHREANSGRVDPAGRRRGNHGGAVVVGLATTSRAPMAGSDPARRCQT